jgi:hypothetical protein
MQIVFNNVDRNGNPVANPPADLVADLNRAKAILESMFFNNITLTFNVALGFFPGSPVRPGNPVTGAGAASPNSNINVFVTYANPINPTSGLRNALLTFGQPNFFTPTNLPEGNSVPVSPAFSISNFWVSSSQAKALGFAPRGAGVDGFIGIGTTVAAGDDRVSTILHEVGHAMGRMPTNLDQNNVTHYSELDLVRFFSPGNRVIIEDPAGYFSLDGGATPLVNWSVSPPSAADFRDPPGNTAPGPRRLDPFNATNVPGNMLAQLTPLDFQVMNALGFTSPVINPPLQPGTTAVMVLRQTSAPPSITNGQYQIYDLGNNATLAGYTLGRLGANWQFVTLGRFNDGDTSDMLLRDGGVFQVYDIVNNTITRTARLGEVGSNWQALAFGSFGPIVGNTDMLLRDSNPAAGGAMFVYNISNNQITGAAPMGAVGLDWQFSGVGNFGNVPGASDLLLRNVDTGGLQVYDIVNNQLANSAFIGLVGTDWQFSGVGNFSSVSGASDLLLRNRTTGALQVYNIANNQLTGSFSLGAIGTDWKFAGVAPIRGAGAASDLVLRQDNTGAFQVYNIANNQLIGSASLGATGADWQLGGFAPAAGPGGGMSGARSSDDLLGSSSQPTAMGGSTAQTRTSTFQLAGANGAAVGSPVDPSSLSSSMLNPAPPDATTANMVLRNVSNTTVPYEIYNLGANSILAGHELGQVGSEWGFVTLGNFHLADSTDMLLRNSTSGEFLVYDIEDNNIIDSISLGAVGVNWQAMGFGIFFPFGGFGETDMLLRDVNTGEVQVYDIFDNEIVDSAFLGTIGLEWQFSGIGNWGSSGTSDLLVRDSDPASPTAGGLQVYNIIDAEIYDSAFIGTVGLEWEFSGVGDFSSAPGESDLLLRNSNTGALQIYDINDNQVTGSAFLGTVGLEWEFAGVAPVRGASGSDLVLRNVNTGAFQVYNIVDHQVTGSAPLGAVGVEWQLGGFASIGSAPPPEEHLPPEMGGSTSQLVQAMAGFGGGSGAGESLNTAPLGSDTSQQTFLTTPHA